MPVVCLVATLLAGAWRWQVLESDHFRVFYPPGFETAARYNLALLETHKPSIDRLVGSDPGRVNVVLEDAGAVSNGAANPVVPAIYLYTFPPPAGGSLGAAVPDWYQEVAVHEYAHIAHMTGVRGAAKLLQIPFGRIFQPNMMSPAWVIEGIAVYAESRLSRFAGRLNAGDFTARVRTLGRAGQLPGITRVTNPGDWFPAGETPYLFGSEFTRYLAAQYGEEKLARFFQRYGATLLPVFTIDCPARQVFGKTLPALFAEWQRAEAAARTDGTVPGERLTGQGWSIGSLQADTTTGTLYYQRTRRWPSSAPTRATGFADIIARDIAAGTERLVVRRSVRTGDGIELPIRVHGDRLYYATRDWQAGFGNATQSGFGIVTVIRMHDLARRRERVLARGRIRAFDVLDDGRLLIARSSPDGRHTVVTVREPERGAETTVYDGELVVGELAVNGLRVACAAHYPGENGDLFLLDIATGIFTRLTSTPFDEIELSWQGDRLFYAANPNHTWRAFAYDFADQRTLAVTAGGAVHQPCAVGRELYFSGPTLAGNDLFRMPLTTSPFIARATQPGDFPPLPAPDAAARPGSFGAEWLAMIPPQLRAPLVLPGSDSTLAFGYGGIGLSPTGARQYAVLAAYDPLRRTPLVHVEYATVGFAPLALQVAGDYPVADGAALALRADLPLLVRTGTGISSVVLAAGADLAGRAFARRVLWSGLRVGVEGVYTSAGVNIRGDIEPRSGTDRTATALTGQLGVTRYFPHALAELELTARAGSAAVALPVRGYPADSTRYRRGGRMRLEVSIPLWAMRGGLWNPSIYFDKLYLEFFGDAAGGPGQPVRAAAGAELLLDTRVLFNWLTLVPHAGACLRRDGQVVPVLGIDVPLPVF